MNALQYERLSKLEAELRGLGAEDPVAFDMNNWGLAASPDQAQSFVRIPASQGRRITVRTLEHPCLTAACAFGRAALMFPEELRFVPSTSGCQVPQVHILHPESGTFGIEAAAEFFGIDDNEASMLFMPATYPLRAEIITGRFVPELRIIRSDIRPTEVADRIAAVLEAHRAEIAS